MARSGQRGLAFGVGTLGPRFHSQGQSATVAQSPATVRLLKSLIFLKINQIAVVGAGESAENPLAGSLVLVFSFTAVWEGWLEWTPEFKFSPVSQAWGISFVARDGNCPCLFPVFTCPFTRFSLGRFVNRMRHDPCSPGGRPCRSPKKKAPPGRKLWFGYWLGPGSCLDFYLLEAHHPGHRVGVGLNTGMEGGVVVFDGCGGILEAIAGEHADHPRPCRHLPMALE